MDSCAGSDPREISRRFVVSGYVDCAPWLSTAAVVGTKRSRINGQKQGPSTVPHTYMAVCSSYDGRDRNCDDDINSSIRIIVTLKLTSLLITQKLALYNNWESRMHLYVGTWAKGVILNQEKNWLSAVNVVHISICVSAALGEATIERTGPRPLWFHMW
jgi:hypothetical protein